MAVGFDCSTALTQSKAQLFYEQGYRFVGRYLADSSSWKRLSPSEAKAISDTGLYIVSFFERYANRVKEGSAAGTIDGGLALKYALEVAQPIGSTIYFCVDYDAPTADFNAIEGYLRAADKEIDGFELGVYGSYDVVKAMYERGVCKKLAQTVAWSKGKRYENACFYQAQIDTPVNGINVDLDESDGNSGGWRLGMAVKESFKLDDAVTDYILAVMSDYWERCQGNEQLQSFTHDCSNALRRATGRPEE